MQCQKIGWKKGIPSSDGTLKTIDSLPILFLGQTAMYVGIRYIYKMGWRQIKQGIFLNFIQS